VDDGPRPSGQPAEDVDLFLRVLERAPALPADVRIVVVPLPDPPYWDTAFTDRLRHVLSTERVPAPWKDMIVLDASMAVEPADFFTLDEHMKPAGHVKLATLVAHTMGCTA
jgi:hypothetical protein